MTALRLALLGAALVACAPAPPAAAGTPAPLVAPDSGGLLGPARIARLSAAEREAWTRYVEASRRRMAADRAVMDAELRAVGRDRMVPAPDVRASFTVEDHMTEAWFRTDSARRLADNVLTYQTPSGGWSKHADMAAGPRAPGQSWFSESDRWSYIGTLDNGSTTEQLRFLARAHAAHGDARYREAYLRGVEWLLAAQFPNGCWPQVYPLQGGYPDAATFNDDAIVSALRVLRDVAAGEPAFVPADVRARAAAAVSRGVECILAAQVVQDGRRTVWGQQHDPLTLAPVGARAYEHPSLTGRESAAITNFLMDLPSPDARVVAAVHAAADWLRASAIHGYEYHYQRGRIAREGAGPLWARMYELGTNRPIFSNRDGVVLYDWEQLTDRRQGYAWYTDEPATTLRRYARWAQRHPRPAGADV